jgi:hypothetical protein
MLAECRKRLEISPIGLVELFDAVGPRERFHIEAQILFWATQLFDMALQLEPDVLCPTF